MHFNIIVHFFTGFVLNNVLSQIVKVVGAELLDHTTVTDSEVFPYVVAIMRKSTYISSGALIDENWILTGGDALFLLRESAREIRVRLGSINYRRGGILLPIKLFEIHPYFSDTKPEYDIALVKLSKPVRLTPKLNPIRVQKKPREITATHFIVTSWLIPGDNKNSKELQKLQSTDSMKRRRILTVSHLHPSDPEKCLEEKEGLDINSTYTIMCLDPSIGSEPCARKVGAPVVLNGILWGIISSWKPEDCELDSGPSFVTLVSAPDISTWIHAGVRGHKWNNAPYRVEVKNNPYDESFNDYEDEDYDSSDNDEKDTDENNNDNKD